MERIFCNDFIIKEVAHELGLTVEVVRNIITTQSEYTRIIIESNSFDCIRWPYLGYSNPNPKRYKCYSILRE